LQARQQARQQAREHATTHHGKEHEERPRPGDRGALFSEIEIPEVEIHEQFLYEREELIMGLSFALVKRARADRSLMDRDLIAALGSLAKKYQTLANSSLIYEPPTANVAHQEIAREVETMIREFREAELQHIGEIPGHMRVRDSDLLKALVFLLRMGLGRTSGRPKSRAFVDFLFAQFPEKNSAIAGPEEGGSRIVIP
jgi:Glu-tRNA(Gln) amidotransferase subunit E-like FAD-binding protein